MTDYAERRPRTERPEPPIRYSGGFVFAWFAIGCGLGVLISFI